MQSLVWYALSSSLPSGQRSPLSRSHAFERIAFCHKLGFVSIDGAIGIVLDFVHPSATDCLLLLGGWDKVPCVFIDLCSHLLLHGFYWLGILGYCEAFWFSKNYHLHHERIIMSHVLTVTEPHNPVLFSSWFAKLLVCQFKGLLNPWFLHDRCTKLIVDRSGQAFRISMVKGHVPDFIFGHVRHVLNLSSLGLWRYHGWFFVDLGQESSDSFFWQLYFVAACAK